MRIWEEKYSNFEEAKKFKKGKDFFSKRWKAHQSKIFSKCKKIVFNKKGKLPKKYTQRYKDFLLITKKLFIRNKEVNILDFGGGFGVGYFYVLQNLNKKFTYTVLEIPSIIKNIKKSDKIKIDYISKIKKKNFDIVNCCSVFQYIDDWKKSINEIAFSNPSYIYFSDMFLGNINSFVTLQNYYESKIPHWFLNFDIFNNELKKNNYKLILKKKMITKRLKHQTGLPMTNFSKEDRILYTLNLLYKKI